MSRYYFRAGKEDALHGPFTLTQCRKIILEESKELFDSSCNCLKRDPDVNWFETVQIFELVATLKPVVKSEIKLEEVQP